MSSVAIVTDSTASLPGDLVRDHAITVVPMQVVVNGVAHDDLELEPAELIAELERGDVSTAAPNPAKWATGIEAARARADEVVVFTVSAEMSSTHQSAVLAAESFGPSVRVIDTRTAAGGQGLVVLAAARAAEMDATAEEVEAIARGVIERVHLVATLDDLGHLMRSGRVPGLAGAAAQRLHVNPMFEFRDGRAKVLHPAIGAQAAAHRMIHSCLATRPHHVDRPRLHLAALDAAATDRAWSLVFHLLEEVPDAQYFIGSFGPVMLTHVGPGLVGLAWWWED